MWSARKGRWAFRSWKEGFSDDLRIDRHVLAGRLSMSHEDPAGTPSGQGPTFHVDSTGAPQPLLTVSDLAGMLQVHEKTIRRMVARRSIPCVRFGSRVRFDLSDLLRWIEARKE